MRRQSLIGPVAPEDPVPVDEVVRAAGEPSHKRRRAKGVEGAAAQGKQAAGSLGVVADSRAPVVLDDGVVDPAHRGGCRRGRPACMPSGEVPPR